MSNVEGREVKYCIGCVYLEYDQPDRGCMGSTMTGIYGEEDAKLACKLGHWRHEFDTESTLKTFESAMKKAETCADFEER